MNEGDACGRERLVTLATAAGRSAVATILLDGPDVVELVDEFFQSASGRPLGEIEKDRIVLGRWRSEQGPGETIVVCRRATQRIELHCHGGTVAPKVILNCLERAGCRQLSWAQWLAATGDNQLAIEADVALSRARTRRAAEILLWQRNGALARAIHSAVDHLQRGEAPAAAGIVAELRSWSEIGLHLTRGWRLVLAGTVNVGKSSLINAILGYDRAIVFDQPGTTRDVVSADTAIDGWPVRISDTAGLRASREPIETAGVELARRHARSADLVLLVFDASTDWDEAQEHLRGEHPGALIIHNKCDLPRLTENRPAGLYVSALTGEGVPTLLDAVVQHLVPEAPCCDQGVPFTDRHTQLLTAAADALAFDDRAQATMLLREILTGRPRLEGTLS